MILVACGGGSAQVAPAAPAPTAAAAPPAAAPAMKPAPSPDELFGRFVDDYFEAGSAFRPTGAVANGFHQYDAKIEDLSRARFEARIAELHAFLDRLAQIDRTRLSFDNAVDAIAIENDARSELLDTETLRLWEKNPMLYASLPGGALDALMKRDFAPKADRLRSLVARLRGLPAVFAAGKANVVQSPPKEFTDLAILMAKGSAGFLEDAVAAWATDAAGGDAALLAEFREAHQAALASCRDFASWLEKDLLPRSKGSYVLGAETFMKKLAIDDMVDMPLDALLAKGEAQLAKDHAAFVATAKKINAKMTPHQVMALVSKDHPTADGLVTDVAKSVEAARQFVVAKDLVTIPSEVRPKIEETPPYERGASSASMDTPGPYETRATEAFYYVTPVEKDWDAKHKEEHLRGFNRGAIALTNVHEAFPGHYVQFLYAPKFPTKTRKLLGAGTNAEGWAHYAEQMMVDEGFGNGDPKIRLAQLEEALLRDCRYVVGVKLHTQGWTVEQGAKLFVDQCFQEPANGFMEARRGTFNPTYLYYTLGKLEIQELRDEYMAKKHASLKDFHNAFVSQGALPIPLVRKILFR
jgi:uncharacterized protein (DUF885 family)